MEGQLYVDFCAAASEFLVTPLSMGPVTKSQRGEGKREQNKGPGAHKYGGTAVRGFLCSGL